MFQLAGTSILPHWYEYWLIACLAVLLLLVRLRVPLASICAGPGDMLALFRCLSCKYSFSSDLKQLALMGAPGRVFTSGEVRLCAADSRLHLFVL